MAVPGRTFSADVGQKSVGKAGPDQIELDLDNIFAMFDPLKKLRDGTQGGISSENIRELKARIVEYVSTVKNFTAPTVDWALNDLAALVMEGVEEPMDVRVVDEQGNVLPEIPVKLFGRNVQPVHASINVPQLDVGGSWITPWMDVTQAPGVLATGLFVKSDVPMRVLFRDSPDNGALMQTLLGLVLDNSPQHIPPIPPRTGYYSWRFEVPGPTGQAAAPTVYETQYRYVYRVPSVVKFLLASDLALRDTSTHDYATDPQYIYRNVFVGTGDGTKPVIVYNGTDQQVTVDIQAVNPPEIGVIHTGTVPAGQRVQFTNDEAPGLDVPMQEMAVRIKADVAPTTGTVRVYGQAWVG